MPESIHPLLHALIVVRVQHIVREIDQQLSQASLGRCIVAEYGREGRVAERLWETLAKGLPCTSVVAQSLKRGGIRKRAFGRSVTKLTLESNARHA